MKGSISLACWLCTPSRKSGKTPMLLIEVQTGTYFGEDDIIRYDDVYAEIQANEYKQR